MRKVSKNFINPHPIHERNDTPEAVRDAFLHVKWHLEKSGWTTENFTDLLGCARQTWYQYGHKLESRGYRQISADALDTLRREVVLNISSQLDRYQDPFRRPRDMWYVGELITFSKTLALYKSAFTGEAVVSNDFNKADFTHSEDEQLMLDWLTAARFATREQLMTATKLGPYDVGRVSAKNPGRPFAVRKSICPIPMYIAKRATPHGPSASTICAVCWFPFGACCV